MNDVPKERSSFRAHRSSLVFVALLPLILFLIPLLKSEVFTLRDHFDYFQPLRLFTAEELRAGRLPLWNPYNASGEPWLANPQTGVFYPPAWLFLVLPFATAYMLFLCVHLVVLGCGAYLLFARRASAGAALVGATALMFSGPMLSLLDVSNNLATLAWIPLALWCALEGRWRSGGAALALAFLGGEPFFAAVGALLYAIATLGAGQSSRVVESPSDGVAESSRGVVETSTGGVAESSSRRVVESSSGPVVEPPTGGVAESSSRRIAEKEQKAPPSARRLDDSTTRRLEDLKTRRLEDSSPRRLVDSSTGRLVGGALVAFGLSAVQLLPFLELVQRSDRAAGLDAALILHHSMPWRDWPRIAIPTDSLALGQQFIPVIYTGAIVCVLAVLGIGRKTWPWLVLLAAVMFVSTGPELIARLPLTLFRYPARLVALAALPIAALAVAGWDRIRPNRRWLDVLVALAIVVDLVPRAWPLLQTAEFRRDVVPYPKEVGSDTKMMRVGVVDPDRRAAWISGYLNLYDRRFDAFTAAPVATDAYVRMYRRLQEKPSREELARKAIGWIITPLDLRFPPAASDRGVHVYRNELTLPMAVLLVRSPLRAIPARVSFDTSHARVTVDAPREGVVVVYQQNAPGWRAAIDGVEAPSHVVDGVFRVVQVTRGHHEIVWTYRPRALFAGAAITAFTLLAVTLFSFVKRSR